MSAANSDPLRTYKDMKQQKKLKNKLSSRNPYLTKLKDKVIKALMDEEVKVFVFGSRARGDNHRRSDIDIGLIPYGKINRKKLARLKEDIDNMNIPYKIEIVDFSQASEPFRKEAGKEVIVWKD